MELMSAEAILSWKDSEKMWEEGESEKLQRRHMVQQLLLN